MNQYEIYWSLNFTMNVFFSQALIKSLLGPLLRHILSNNLSSILFWLFSSKSDSVNFIHKSSKLYFSPRQSTNVLICSSSLFSFNSLTSFTNSKSLLSVFCASSSDILILSSLGSPIKDCHHWWIFRWVERIHLKLYVIYSNSSSDASFGRIM